MRFDDETNKILSYGGDANAFLTALNDSVALFRGSTLGNACDGTVDVEFPAAVDAYAFLEHVQMTDAAIFRDPVRSPRGSVVIIISLPLFMYRQAVSARLG